MNSARVYGWFEDSAAQPVYDPPHDAACPLCGNPITATDVRTISLMWGDRHGNRSYFYRAHRTCHNGLSDDESNKLDGEILDRVAAEFRETTKP